VHLERFGQVQRTSRELIVVVVTRISL
jgi:hypothetical protein